MIYCEMSLTYQLRYLSGTPLCHLVRRLAHRFRCLFLPSGSVHGPNVPLLRTAHHGAYAW